MKDMRRKLTRIVLSTALCSVGVLSFAIATLGQRTTPASIRVNDRKSSVFMSFVRAGKAGTENEERIWLRFNNNTRWGIRLDMGGEEKVFGNARLFYDILSGFEKIDRSVRCHVCSFNVLGPGKSLLFSVPKADLVGSYAIQIQYSCAWEDDLDSGEPSHFVYFYSRSLPDAIREKS